MNNAAEKTIGTYTFDSGTRFGRSNILASETQQNFKTTHFFDSTLWSPATSLNLESQARIGNDDNGAACESFKVICYQDYQEEIPSINTRLAEISAAISPVRAVTRKHRAPHREASKRDLPPDSGWRYLPTCISQ